MSVTTRWRTKIKETLKYMEKVPNDLGPFVLELMFRPTEIRNAYGDHNRREVVTRNPMEVETVIIQRKKIS